MESQYLLTRRAEMMGTKPPEPKKEAKPIKKKSGKLKDAEKVYRKLRKQYLSFHIQCQVQGCNHVSTELHHMRGRGKYLTDENYFMAVCNEHHRKITDDSAWAIKEGYSYSRLSK